MIRKVKDTLKFKEERNFIEKTIDIYTAIFMDTHLTAKERSYFTELVLLNKQGINLLSRKANETLTEKLGFHKKNDRGIWIYRGKLKEKGWLIKTKENIKLLPVFDFKNKEIDTFFFNVNISYEQNTKENNNR